MQSSEGNDSTSVALFFPRNCRFKDCTAALLVTRTFTVPWSLAARRARRAKRSSATSLSPAIRFCRMTNLVSALSAAFLRVLCEEGVSVPSPKANRRAHSGALPHQCRPFSLWLPQKPPSPGAAPSHSSVAALRLCRSAWIPPPSLRSVSTTAVPRSVFCARRRPE